MGRFRAFVGDTLRAILSQAVEVGIALADMPERPVHRFLDEIARIRGAFLDDRQLGRKDVIRRRFIMDRQHRNHGERSPFDEFLLAVPPIAYQITGEIGFPEQVRATLVA